MKKRWILIWLLLFCNYPALCQKRIGETKNYLGVSYVAGTNDPNAYEYSYERTVNCLGVRTGLMLSIIPRYQYDEGAEGILVVLKNYSRQNLIVFEASPYLFMGSKSEQAKGFFLKGGPFIIPFHIKYDKITTLGIDFRDVIYKKVDRYSLNFGIGGAAGVQFSLFGSKQKLRIEASGKATIPPSETGILMLNVSAGISF